MTVAAAGKTRCGMERSNVGHAADADVALAVGEPVAAADADVVVDADVVAVAAFETVRAAEQTNSMSH